MKQKQFEEDFPHLPSSPIVESVIQWTARSAFGSHEQAWQDVFKERLKDFPTVFPIQSQSIETMIVPDVSTHQTVNRPWAGLRLESADKKLDCEDGLSRCRTQSTTSVLWLGRICCPGAESLGSVPNVRGTN
jgi:hypothetical protein